MKVAIIGRSEILYNCAITVLEKGHTIALVVTSKETPEYKVTSKDFEELASEIGAEYIYTPKINEEAILNKIEKLGEIDIAISINYSGIISNEVIDCFKLGILNAHGGDLPRYRGNACQSWALINGETRIGLCIHKMIGSELDSGDIIERSYLKVDINTRIGEVYQWIEEETPTRMFDAIQKLSSDKNYVLEKQSKKPSKALRCYPRKPEDGKINWNCSAEDILRLINASSEPFSGAFSDFENEKIIIWRAEILIDNENYLAIPGQVCLIDHNSNCIIVITRSGKLKITEIEFKGERCNPNTVIKSIRKRLGTF
ncbi:formyltransferase family protein [Crocinitomicaceae bacterium]|mgnify:CR=1 FL=1|nr:formyltransferase family protein [Crocinitomicaceae bacterium]